MFGARGPATPCQPDLVKVLCAAPPTHQLRTKIQMRLKSPPSPDPPTSQSYWQRVVLYRILYCATYSTVPHTVLGSPQLSWRNATGPKLRPQTAPRRDLKATKKPLPAQVGIYLPPHHHIIVWRRCIYSNIFEYFLNQIVIRTLFISNFRRNNIHCFKAAYK